VTVLRQAESRVPVPKLCRGLGISQATFFRSKKTYGCLEVAELRELRSLPDENRRLKQLVGDSSLDKTILQEAVTRNGKARRAAPSRNLGSRVVADVRAAGMTRSRPQAADS